ncbi:MAG: sulfatase-like hydrolase/transferase, partial [Planctomycetota bacterium]
MAFSIPWTEPRRRHRRGRPAPGWLLVAVSLAAACGPESARAPAAVDVLSEGREMGAAAGEARDPLARFVVTRGNTATCPWTVEGAERSGFTLLQPTEGAFDRFEMIPGLALYGADELSVTQPAPHRAGDVGAVAARLWCGGSAGTRSVRAVAIDERGEARETSAWRSVAVGVEPRFVEFELAPSMEAGAARAGVRIEFAAGGPWAAVASVAVFGPGPPGPRVGSPELVFVGSTAMRAATLVEDAPWEVRLRGDGVEPQRLRMALARRGTEQLPRDAGLFVAVEAARRGEQLCVRALDVGVLEDSHWNERDVDLGVLPARDCVLRLWLKGGEGRPARLLVGDAAVVRSTPAPPTVLLITSDTHRADHLGALDASLRTPALDALARRGLLFERAYSTTTITNPGHVALMTGLHPRDTRIVDNKTRLATSVDTLAEAFQAAGKLNGAATAKGHRHNLDYTKHLKAMGEE